MTTVPTLPDDIASRPTPSERRRSARPAAVRARASWARRSATASASSTPGRWRATRSCSWSRSAACSRTFLFFRDFASSTSSENVFAGLVAVVAVVHRAVRQLRRGGRRRPRQGAGRHAAQDAVRDDRQRPARRRHGRARCRRSQLAARRRRASSTPARSSRATARSSKASRRSTSRRSPASRRR